MQRGFNLIEMLIVIAIVAILIALVQPSYQHYLQYIRRQNAKVALVQAAARLAEYYNQHGDYSEATLNTHASTDYQITLTNLDAQTFTLNAVPIGAQQHDACGKLSVNQNNQQFPNNKNCW